MRCMIDRIEGETAVCEAENGERIRLSLKVLPFGAAEGDALLQREGAWTIDREETEKRRLRMQEKLKKLME